MTGDEKRLSVLFVYPRSQEPLCEQFQQRFPLVKAHFLGTDSWYDQELPTDCDVHLYRDVEVLFVGLSVPPGVLPLLPNLKWIQTGSAGPNAVIKLFQEHKIPRSVVLTRNGVTFKLPLSQYVMGHILSCNMQFRQHATNQQTATWKESKLVTNEKVDKAPSYGGIKSLPKSTVTVLGVGRIGQEIARACKFLGMTVVGVTRSKVEEGKRTEFVDKYRQSTELPEALRSCDYLVNVLPSTKETRGLLNGDVLSQCKNKPVFINVGRGDIIDDKSVINALRRGWLSCAVLDTFEVEPLPVDSPLWREPNIVITPHIAYGYQNENTIENVVKMFGANFERYIRKEPLKDAVDIDRGY